MKTIHIAQEGYSPFQNGSRTFPYLVSPNDPSGFDGVFKKHRGPTTFMLGPGEYSTRGAWSFPETNYALIDPNSSLIAPCGSEATKIVLCNDYASSVNGQAAQYIETIIGGGPARSGSNQMTVSGLTIDCRNSRLPVIGLHLYSGGALVSDVAVLGIHGRWGGMEGFGILVNDSMGARGGGSTIERCRVETTVGAESYLTGIYLGSTTVRGAPNSIRDCVVEAKILDGIKRAHAAYAANESTTVQNCVGNGFDRFLFSDTGSAEYIEVTGCRGDFGYCAIDYPALPVAGNVIGYRRRMRVSNCTFSNDVPSTDHSIFLLLQDQSAAHDITAIEDIDVDGVRVSSAVQPGGEGKGFFIASIQAAKAKRIWIRNCTFPMGAKTEAGVYAPTPNGAVSFDNIKFE